MASGYLRLNGRFFRSRNLKPDLNKHQLSHMESVSYPTLLRYLDGEKEVTRFDGEILYAILVTGMGHNPEELAEMKFGDLFEIVSSQQGAAK